MADVVRPNAEQIPVVAQTPADIAPIHFALVRRGALVELIAVTPIKTEVASSIALCADGYRASYGKHEAQ
jgi:hypothetical protein